MTGSSPPAGRGSGSSGVPYPLLNLLLAATVGGVLLTVLHVPAGGIIGAVLGSGLVSMSRSAPTDTAALRLGGLCFLGIASGLRLDAATLGVLGSIAVPVLISIGGLVAVQFGLAWVLTRLGIDAATAVLSAAPGGLGEIGTLAGDVKADVGVVTAIHVVRIVIVVLVMLPILVSVFR